MSYNWCLYSFDYGKFERALRHSKRTIIDAVLAEIRAFEDDPRESDRYDRVGRRLIEEGFSYQGWPERDLTIVDRFVFSVFHACAGEIDREAESPALLSPMVTCEFPSNLRKRFFWSRPEPIPAEQTGYRYLPFFTHHGRRLGQDFASFCEYIVFDPNETHTLKREVETFLASPEGRTLDARYGDTVRDDLLGPLRSAVGKGKSLYAQLS